MEARFTYIVTRLKEKRVPPSQQKTKVLFHKRQYSPQMSNTQSEEAKSGPRGKTKSRLIAADQSQLNRSDHMATTQQRYGLKQFFVMLTPMTKNIYKSREGWPEQGTWQRLM